MALNAEEAFVLHALRRCAGIPFPLDSIGRKDSASLDWSVVMNHLVWHRLAGLFAFYGREDGILEQFPPKIRAQLLHWEGTYRRQNQVAMAWFREASQIFSNADIPVIPLKGVAITPLIYHEAPLRTMGDIDLLIRESDRQQVEEILRKEGYLPYCSRVRNRWQAAIVRELQSHSLQDDQTKRLGRVPYFNGRFEVDLHWRPIFGVGERCLAVECAPIWRDASPAPELGRSVLMLSARHQWTFHMRHALELANPLLIQLLDLVLLARKGNFGLKDFSEELFGEFSGEVQKHVEDFWSATLEVFDEQRGSQELSQGTKLLLEKFFEPEVRRHHEASKLRQGTEFSFLKNIPSWRKRFLFLLGYLLPDPAYYSNSGLAERYVKHWSYLLVRLLRSLFFLPAAILALSVMATPLFALTV